MYAKIELKEFIEFLKDCQHQSHEVQTGYRSKNCKRYLFKTEFDNGLVGVYCSEVYNTQDFDKSISLTNFGYYIPEAKTFVRTSDYFCPVAFDNRSEYDDIILYYDIYVKQQQRLVLAEYFNKLVNEYDVPGEPEEEYRLDHINLDVRHLVMEKGFEEAYTQINLYAPSFDIYVKQNMLSLFFTNKEEFCKVVFDYYLEHSYSGKNDVARYKWIRSYKKALLDNLVDDKNFADQKRLYDFLKAYGAKTYTVVYVDEDGDQDEEKVSSEDLEYMVYNDNDIFCKIPFNYIKKLKYRNKVVWGRE